MTPQEMNDEALRRAKEEQDKLTEATLAGADATDKAKAANLKMETATGMAVQQLQKLLDVQLRYTIAMAKGVKGSAAFNDSVDATADVMTTAVNAIGTALAFLLPGGVLVKGLVAGLTFLTTNAIKSAAALQKAANEQGDALDKAYKSMSKSGATASDGMTGLFKDVNRMRLNVMQLDAMAQTMANNAKEMTAMGGTVYKARKEYADLTENMKGFEKGMLMLGMSHEDQAEAVMGFMKLQSNLSQGQQKDYGKMSGAARKYVEEQEALARVTGVSRKQQEANQEKFLAQQRYGAKIQELMDEGTVESTNKAKLLQKGMDRAAAQGEMFAQSYADQTTGMLTTDAAVRGNTATQGKQLEQINAVLEGRITNEEELNAAHQDTIAATKEFGKTMNKVYQMGGEDMMFPFKELQDISKAATNNFAVQMKDAETEVKKLTGTIAGADAQLTRRVDMEIEQNNRMMALQKNADNKFMDTAIGTGTFMEKLAKAVEPLINLFNRWVQVVTPLVSGMGDLLIGTIGGLIKLLTGDFSGAFKDVKDGIMSFGKGYIETIQETGKFWKDSLTQAGANLKKSLDDMLGLFGSSTDEVAAGLKQSYDNFSESLGKITTSIGKWSEDTWELAKKSVTEFGADLLKGIGLITSPLTDAFDKVKTGILGITDGLKESMGKFGNILVDMVNDIWNKLLDLIPGMAKAKEVAGEAIDTTKRYAQTGADAVKNAGDTAVDFVSSIFGGGGAPAAAPAAPAPAGGAPAAPAGGAPASSSGGKPAAAAPASSSGGKPAAAAPASSSGGGTTSSSGGGTTSSSGGGTTSSAPASSSGGFFSSIGDLFGGGEKVATTTPSAPPGTAAAGDKKPSTSASAAPAAPAGKPEELGPNEKGVQPDILAKKAQLEEMVGKKLKVTSGLRSSSVNHAGGLGIDIGLGSNNLSEDQRNKIFEKAISLGFTGLGAEYKAEGGPHIHLDKAHSSLTGWGSDHKSESLMTDSPFLAKLIASKKTDTNSAPASTSASLVDFIKGFEKFSPMAHQDFKQISIGFGTKAKSKDEGPITEADAESRLLQSLSGASGYVANFQKKNPKYKWGQPQMDALSSFAYNGGNDWINQVTDDGKRSNAEILKMIPAYNKAGGEVAGGLVRRRAAEAAMFAQNLQAAKGGVFDGPKSGYAATLHGNEAVIPLKDGAVPVSMSQEFNMTAVNLGELVNQMKYNMAVQDRMVTVLEEIRRAQTTTADNTGRMVAYASN